MRAGTETQGPFFETRGSQARTHGLYPAMSAVASPSLMPPGMDLSASPVSAVSGQNRARLEISSGRAPSQVDMAELHGAATLRDLQAADRLAVSGRDRSEVGESLLSGMPLMHLLVIDEDEPVLRAICEIAAEMGFRVHAAASASAATDVMERHTLDMVLMDLRSREGGLPLVQQIHSRCPRAPIVVMTAFATVHSAMEAIRLGATDYLTKPFAMEELTGMLRDAAQHRQFDVETRRLQESLQGDAGARGLIGASPAMQKLFRIVSKVAYASHPVLIVGESGSGKESFAKLIHRSGEGGVGPEADAQQQAVPVERRPFFQIDCMAIAPAVLEAELLGYVRDEGTAEREEKAGLLTLPGGCTLYIDEIGAMPLELQAKLLRALQEKKVRPVGAAVALPVTARVIAASSCNLPQLVETGGFRKDLYFRLNVVNLRIPPLRERREDIPQLVAFFLEKQSRDHAVAYRLDGEVLRVLDGYDWPGNVRELESAVERACSMSSGPMICLADLPTQLQGYRQQLGIETLRIDERAPDMATSLPERMGGTYSSGPTAILSIAAIERQAILSTIGKLNGDKLMAAKLLGIGKTTLYRKLKEYGIRED